MGADRGTSRRRRWLRPVAELVGYVCTFLAGVVLFGVGSTWGFLLFVPAFAAVAFLLADHHQAPPAGGNRGRWP